MRIRFRIPVFLAAAVLLAPVAASAQKAVFVVRHAEKISDDDQRLTEAGRARAARLAVLLKDAGVAAIYATDTERARDTVAPLARALKQTVRVYDKPADLVATLRKERDRDVVLVVGHSNTVPELLALLGGSEAIEIGPEEYDNLFVAVPKGADGTTVLRLRY